VATPPAARGGLTDALRAFAGSLEETARVRGALFAVELQEEVERRKGMAVLAVTGIVFLHAVLLLFAVLVAAVFWDTHRIAALGTLTVLYLACGAAALLRLRTEMAAAPAPFAATLEELHQDLAQWRRAP
jgi:uncharacterized membrane protein YqjE